MPNKLSFTRVVLCLTLLALMGLPTRGLASQQPCDRFALNNQAVVMESPDADSSAGASVLPTGLAKIYSNLGTGNNVYSSFAACNESGSGSPHGIEFQPMAFTPNADYSVKRIDLAVSWIYGNNDYILTLRADNGGVPGAILMKWPHVAAANYGTCCALETVRVPRTHKPVLLQKGKQYWLVVNLREYAWLVWNLNTTNTSGKGALSHDGKKWIKMTFNTNGAFDVLGVRQP